MQKPAGPLSILDPAIAAEPEQGEVVLEAWNPVCLASAAYLSTAYHFGSNHLYIQAGVSVALEVGDHLNWIRLSRDTFPNPRARLPSSGTSRRCVRSPHENPFLARPCSPVRPASLTRHSPTGMHMPTTVTRKKV